MENRSGGDIENVKQAARDVDKDKFAGLYT
jgi:hypothetical protein